MTPNNTPNFEFFASANGFNGFKSYFNEIFNPCNLTKLFILKGGPGTGKSTILKKIGKFANENNLNYEIFRCSSDPNSLDGIIIKSNESSVAVIDGTAPHQMDTVIPGAFDELINLGAAWNSKELNKEMEEIKSLNILKSQAYQNAYNYLSISSVFNKKIKAEIKKIFNYNLAEEKCKNIIQLYQEDKGKVDIRLISSFSKNGYERNNCFEKVFKEKYTVKNTYGSASLFLSILTENLKKHKISFINIPSPLDENEIEGIYLNEYATLIISEKNTENCINNIDTSEFINLNLIKNKEKELNIFEEHLKLYMNLAKDELCSASKYHFELEKIYTPKMNFSIIESIYDDLLQKIKNTLFP